MSDNYIQRELERLQKATTSQLRRELLTEENHLDAMQHNIEMARAEVSNWEKQLAKARASELRIDNRLTAIKTLIAFRENYPAKK